MLQLLLFLAASVHVTNGAVLETGSSSWPYTDRAPVKDFSLVLTFSEPVQATNDGMARITLQNSAVVAPATDPNQYQIGCLQKMAWFGRRVIVPVTSASLTADTQHKLIVPSTCFRTRGSTSTYGSNQNVKYLNTLSESHTFTTEQADQCSSLPPMRLSGALPATSSIPLSP